MKTFKLENEPKIKSGFIIPESYLEHFSEKVMAQLLEEDPKVISLFLRRKSWIYIAATLIGLGLIIPIYNNFNSHSSEINEVILENYIVNKSDISETELASLLDGEDIQKMSIGLDIEDQLIENELSINTNLEQYITN
jgi:hypothetical protein